MWHPHPCAVCMMPSAHLWRVPRQVKMHPNWASKLSLQLHTQWWIVVLRVFMTLVTKIWHPIWRSTCIFDFEPILNLGWKSCFCNSDYLNVTSGVLATIGTDNNMLPECTPSYLKEFQLHQQLDHPQVGLRMLLCDISCLNLEDFHMINYCDQIQQLPVIELYSPIMMTAHVMGLHWKLMKQSSYKSFQVQRECLLLQNYHPFNLNNSLGKMELMLPNTTQISGLWA